MITGGQKVYAPRVATGRLSADAALFLRDEKVLLTVEEVRFKDATGQNRVKRTLAVVDIAHVVGLEFDHLKLLRTLDVPEPPEVRETEYRASTMVG